MKKAVLNLLEEADTSLVFVIWYYYYLKIQMHCIFIILCKGKLPAQKLQEIGGELYNLVQNIHSPNLG